MERRRTRRTRDGVSGAAQFGERLLEAPDVDTLRDPAAIQTVEDVLALAPIQACRGYGDIGSGRYSHGNITTS